MRLVLSKAGHSRIVPIMPSQSHGDRDSQMEDEGCNGPSGIQKGISDTGCTGVWCRIGWTPLLTIGNRHGIVRNSVFCLAMKKLLIIPLIPFLLLFIVGWGVTDFVQNTIKINR